MKRIWKIGTAILLGIALILGGCQAGDAQKNEESSQENIEGIEKVRLYYTNETATTLREEMVLIEENLEIGQRIEKVMEALKNPPEGLVSIIPEGLKIVYEVQYEEECEGPSIRLYAQGKYETLTPNVENVFRVGLMKSLIRMEGVENVELYADKRDESGKLTRSRISYLTEDTVIVNEADENFFRDTVEVTLYFLNATGDKLVTEKREATVLMSDRIVDKIVMMLIEGPQEEGHKASIPAGTVINEILVRNNVCYVDLSENFVRNQLAGESAEMLTLYSIVNSLTRQDGVDSVQFLIDGQQREYFKSNVKINTPLSFNEELVDK